jgi:uncharacterized membrane protein
MTASGAAAARWRLVSISLLLALLLLSLIWELWLAPLRPGGSWLALKTLPLLWILPGIARGRLYTYRASTLLILAYFTEGTVRAWSDSGFSVQLAGIETALSLAFFCAAIAFVRSSRSVRSATPTTAA